MSPILNKYSVHSKLEEKPFVHKLIIFVVSLFQVMKAIFVMSLLTIIQEQVRQLHGFVCCQTLRSVHPQVIVSNRSDINENDVILGVRGSNGVESFSFENISNDHLNQYLLNASQVEFDKLTRLYLISLLFCMEAVKCILHK